MLLFEQARPPGWREKPFLPSVTQLGRRYETVKSFVFVALLEYKW